MVGRSRPRSASTEDQRVTQMKRDSGDGFYYAGDKRFTKDFDESLKMWCEVSAQEPRTSVDGESIPQSIDLKQVPCLYILAGVPGFLKVGHSLKLTSRVASLQTANPHHVWVAACRVFETRARAKTAERKILRAVSAWRGSGGHEWFRLTPESYKVLEQLIPEIPDLKMLNSIKRREKRLRARDSEG